MEGRDLHPISALTPKVPSVPIVLLVDTDWTSINDGGLRKFVRLTRTPGTVSVSGR